MRRRHFRLLRPTATLGCLAGYVLMSALPASAQVTYSSAPNVNITPLYDNRSMVSLTDVPTSFTKSTNPVSTYYAPAKKPNGSYTGTTSSGQAVSITLHDPVPAKTAAHIPAKPTSYGSTYTAPQSQSLSIATAPPKPHIPQQPQISWPHVPAGTITPPSGLIASPQLSDGSYWEQVSGPTLFGNTLATKVVCKRPAPVAPPPPVQQQHTVTTVQIPQITLPPRCAPAPVTFPPAFLPTYPAPVFLPPPPVFPRGGCSTPPIRPACGPSVPFFPPHFVGQGINTGPALPYVGFNPAPYGILSPNANSRWTY